MLAHPWFTDDDPATLPSPPPLDLNSTTAVSSQDGATTNNVQPLSSPNDIDIAAAVTNALLEQVAPDTREASESSSTTSDAQHSGASDDSTDLTSVTTPDAPPSPDVSTLPLGQAVSMLDAGGVSRSGSQSTLGPKHDTLRTQPASRLSLTSRKSDSAAFAALAEEGEGEDRPLPTVSRSGSLKGKPSAPPSAFPTRTPARTKRRSVSSNNISAPTSPTEPSFPTGICAAPIDPQHYASLLTVQAPLLFTTPLERSLLSSLSALGFDTGQIVHSVLTDACDSNGALWWLLKKKAERRELAETRRIAEERRKTLEALDDPSKRKSAPGVPNLADTSLESMLERPSSFGLSAEGHESPPQAAPVPPPSPPVVKKDDSQTLLFTPQISFVPPTPNVEITPAPRTPPNQEITSSSSTATLGADVDGSLRSTGSTPSTPGTPKEKKSNKPRSSSVSMLQRAAGLVRKKSEEKVKDRDEAAESSTATPSAKLSWGRASESTVNSHSSASAPSPNPSKSFPPNNNNKLTKSPPSGKGKDKEVDSGYRVQSSLTPEWTSLDSAQTPTQQAHASRQVFKLTSPSFLSTHVEDRPTESFSSELSGDMGSRAKGRTQRASIFNTFRTWFQEDRKKAKGKGQTSATPLMQTRPLNATPSSPSTRSRQGTYKAAKKRVGGFGHSKRPSISSRRSSSVNSRRSSVTSIPPQRRPSDFMVPPLSPDSMHRISRQRSDASRRSVGSRTPSSEVGSRPSSIRSFNRTPRARPPRTRSPSQSSTGSSRARQTASPIYHRRLGSGSSSRVVRQVHMAHGRSNSQASSTRSSRHNSLDVAGPLSLDLDLGIVAERSITPVRERKQPTTVFVAHKQNSVFGAPSARLATHGRNSWKKSWGAEPPSWQSRTAHAALETFSDPGHGGSIRDVFTGRASLDPGDEDEWVDEDDETPAFVGGLGQLPAPVSSVVIPGSISTPALPPSPSLRSRRELPPLMGAKLRPALGARSRPTSNPVPPRSLQIDNGVTRSAILRVSPTPPLLPSAGEPNSTAIEPGHLGPGPRGRRQIQGGRSGPAFKHAIQEEDEGEEE